MGTGRCSTVPIVVSVTDGAEHIMKHLHETTKGFPVTKPLMLLDICTKSAVFILKQNICFEQWTKIFTYPRNTPIHEEPIYKLNPCHALECYYNNETWLRTQTVTALTRITHWMGERIPRKLETANNTRCILEYLPWPCWTNGTAMICQNWQNGKATSDKFKEE